MFMCGSAVRGFGCIGAPFMRGVTRHGPGWAVAARFNGPDMGARGNCTTRRFDTPATRRSDASNGANPPFGPPGAPSMAGWRLWRDEAWAGLGGCSSFQRTGYGSMGGIALQGGSTRRRHAVAMRLMVQNPPLGGGAWASRGRGVAGGRPVATWESGSPHGNPLFRRQTP